MIDLLSVYICPKCGDVLEDQVQSYEVIDIERDDVWTEKIHVACGHSVTRKMADGLPCFQSVDHERWLWACGFYDEPEEDDDDWDDDV